MTPEHLQPALLTPVVRAATGRANAVVLDAHSEPIAFGPINPATRGLYRCWGTAADRGEALSWSCVLKIAQSTGRGGRGAHWNFWDRESRVYASGALADLPEGVEAPRCYGVVRRRGASWIWIEAIEEERPGPWPLSRYRTAGRHLGRLNATRWRRPAQAVRQGWLCEGWLRKVAAVRRQGRGLLADPRTWTDPWVRRAFPEPQQARYLGWYDRIAGILDRYERLPQGICHFDAYRPNLFSRGRGEGERTVLIDWAFLGTGPLGGDVGQLLAGNALWLLTPPDQLEALFHAVVDGYVDGVRDAGRRASRGEIEWVGATSAAMRAALYLPFLLEVIRDPARHGYWAKQFGRSPARSLPEWGDSMRRLLELSEALEPRGA